MEDYIELPTPEPGPPAEKLLRLTILRRAFLIYWPHTTPGWVFHILFYFFVLMVPVALLGTSIPPKGNDPSFDYLLQVWGQAVIVVAVYGILAALFQRLARRADSKQGRSLAAPRA